MDAKDLRIEPALSDRSSDASKYTQSGNTLQCNRHKSYQDIGSNSSAKVDTASARPCAVIGPDRVVLPTESNEVYLKKTPVEPWPCPDNVYHRPPEYPHKAAAYLHPTRNISPRQTFQENMQRIMVPPTYNSVKGNEDAGFIQKVNVTSDTKYCDVPYSVNNTANDPKNTRSVEMCLPNVSSGIGRPPHGWLPSGINVHPQRPFVSSDMYQFPEYPSCAGPRPVSISRPHRTISEESGFMYPEHYYSEPNIRFKPYPSVKERYPQPRYDYVTNYSNPFHPSPCPPQKYDIPKSLPLHPYSGYPHVKYIDSRMGEPMMEGYQRPLGQQGSYNLAYRNQIVHPQYGPMLSNNTQSKIPPYPPDGAIKAATSNKLPYDSNAKIYVEYENTRVKSLPLSESFYSNEMTRHHTIPKGIVPNYPSINVHSVPPHSYYKKDNPQIQNYEYNNHYKNNNNTLNMNSPMQRLIPQFSPNGIVISPTDSNTSNDTLQTHITAHEECGYISQSSSSLRSIDLGKSRIPNDFYTRYYDPRYGPVMRAAPPLPKTNRNKNSSCTDNKEKKDMDVRKFLQMWNEGDDDNNENNSSKETIHNNSNEINKSSKPHGVLNNQEQLYVLGLVNVPSEELSKYEHIQKVSKLPENIKGYNSIELLNQFEEAIESSNMNGFKLPLPNEFHVSTKQCVPKHSIGILPRPISPLDVEAKISQSVIHKEVGCNFEIKPCSPKMLNVEIAAPVQNILNERVIEKVTNPLSMTSSPLLNGIDNIEHCKIPDARQDQIMLEDSKEISSCKMINTQFSNPVTNSIKSNYSIQDLESNAGVCLASLPRLDNDIELNFPEVNQQFINANKGEKIIKTQLKELPELYEVDQTEKIINDIKPDVLSPKVEAEREFTKLSKYRKMKTNIPDARQDKLAVKAVRTDSVIIKNPENVSEISKDHIIKTSQDISEDLPLQEHFVDDNVAGTNMLIGTEYDNIKPISPGIAIDFRLPKNTEENLEISHITAKKYEPVKFSKEEEILNKNYDLHKNKDEVVKCPDIYKEGVINKQIQSAIVCTEKQSENDTTLDKISSAFNMASLDSSSETEYSNVTNIESKMNIPQNLPCSTESITSSESTHKQTGLELQNREANKSFVETVNTSDKTILTTLHMESNDMKFKNEVIDVLICNESYDRCRVIKPTEDVKIIDSIDHSESDQIVVEGDITENEMNENILLQNESTILLPAPNTTEEQNKVNKCMSHENINSNSIITSELQKKEDWISNDITYDTKQNIEVPDISKFCEDFGIKQQNRSKETDPNCNMESAVDLRNSTIFAQNDIKSVQNFSKRYGYGSKELYSPWIQNLIMFNEGICYALYSEQNKASIIVDNNLHMIPKSTRIDSGTCSDNISNFTPSESTVCESINKNNISDETLQSIEDSGIKTDTLLHSISEHQNTEVSTNEDEINNTQGNLPPTDNHNDGISITNENDMKTRIIHEELLCGLVENTCIIKTTESNPLVKIEETKFESYVIDQTTVTQDECTIKSDENKSEIDPSIFKQIIKKRRMSLKRSLSDSALNLLNNDITEREISVLWPYKRSKLSHSENVNESEIIAQNLCNILQHNRRNSISAVYNEDVSFCILIEDNNILTEENEEAEKNCYTEIEEDCLNEMNNTYTCDENNEDVTNETIACEEEIHCEYSNNITLNYVNDVTLDETWVEDIACMETIVSDDIAEDIIISSASNLNENDFWDNEKPTDFINSDKEDDAVADSFKYEDGVHYSDPKIPQLCESSEEDVNRTLLRRDCPNCETFNGLYDNDLLEKILSETNCQARSPCDNIECVISSESPKRAVTPGGKANIKVHILSESITKEKCFSVTDEAKSKLDSEQSNLKTYENTQKVTVHSCESSIDVFSNKRTDDITNYAISSSPEVSSTTSEEKNSSLLLKITNYKGTKISQINNFNTNNNNTISCKFTEKTDYVNPNAKLNSYRPMLTKAAQKYIPPIKESIRDLKVKLSLPPHSLLKLKQIKTAKDEPKFNKQSSVPSKFPKKQKPNFEDVLKSIDEIQIKMHKEKTKKVKKSIPKVVIKKSENGSHYASTSNKETFNPDLTGRKWQPWVFLEKNNFIDKMATRRKTKAIFSHRKNAFVLSEKFHKYKSANSTKFIISQPKLSDSSTGQLKYTIRLKHCY